MKIQSSKAKGKQFEAWVKQQFDTVYNFGEYDLRLPGASINGCDVVINSELAEEVMKWGPECKRVERPLINQWWTQTVTNANLAHLHPVLFWRQSRLPAVAIIKESHWSTFNNDMIGLCKITKMAKFHTTELPFEFEPICFMRKPYPDLVMILASNFFRLIDRLQPNPF